MRGRNTRAAVWILLPVFFVLNHIRAVADDTAYVSIIIDDLGNSTLHAEDILDIPAPVTLAILPNTFYGPEISRRAIERGKEVMLHLPMQSVAHHHPSPGTLTLHMTERAFKRQLRANLASLPNIRGLNNHMGSLLTQHPGYMEWLMEIIAEHGDYYFVDSRTTTKSVASRFADMHAVPNSTRDVFLDPDFREETILRQFQRLVSTAKSRGSAIGIAHPHPRTIEFISNNITTLEQQGIKLVPVSTLIEMQKDKEVLNDVACTGPACSGM